MSDEIPEKNPEKSVPANAPALNVPAKPVPAPSAPVKSSVPAKDDPLVPAKKYRFSTGMWSLLALRLFIAARMIGLGLEKFASEQTVYDPETGVPAIARSYAFENYHPIPPEISQKLAGDLLFPQWALDGFAMALGPMIIGMGITVLLGVKLKLSLMILAIFLCAMTFALAIANPAGQPPIFDLLAVAAALYLAEKNRRENLEN